LISVRQSWILLEPNSLVKIHNKQTLATLIVCGLLLAGNGSLQWVVDSDLGVCWTHNVLRNWQEFGLFALRGQLVMNPGGYGALDHPAVYSGHRPASLYPAFFIERIFAWTGFHALPYHLLAALLVWISIWFLLGRTDKALFIGAVALLAPGYIEEPTLVDPNAVAILGGFPYAAFLWWQLRQPRLKPGAIILVAIVTLIFTALNWTTALVHAQIFVTLMTARAITPRRLVFYALAGVAAAAIVVSVGLMSKLQESGGSSPGALSELLRSYFWGKDGYGGHSSGLSTGVLLGRVAVINVLALLPFWVVWGWNWFQCLRAAQARAVRSLAPLALAVLQIVGMRNYFAHLPWMAAPLLLLGCVLSLLIMAAPSDSTTSRDTSLLAMSSSRTGIWKPSWLVGAIAAFCFGLVVVVAVRVHNFSLISLVTLVRQDTHRSDEILISAARDPQLARVADRLDQAFDRRVVVVNTLPASENSGPGILLTASPLENGEREVGRMRSADQSPLIGRPLAWFSKHIIRRKAGDKVEIGETCYLYHVTSAKGINTAVIRQ
jgi:hypothetical protein